MTIKEASIWASKHIGKNVTPSNISYLIQYGRIPKNGDNGNAFVNRYDLEEYYNLHHETKEGRWKKKLGNDLNWKLSFSEYKESETTKHVHRLHSYKGKFIPQLVEYFLDSHTDDFKKQSFFKPDDIILDPFCGSGTTLVQANELEINSVGIDISAFNAFISNMKIGKHDIKNIESSVKLITNSLNVFQKGKNNIEFEIELLDKLKLFNSKYFPSPEYKFKVRHNKIDEKGGYSFLFLNPFKEEDFIKYLKKFFPDDWEKYYETIINTYNLRELAEKPILLELMVQTLPQIKIEENEKLNHASLYDRYTKFWLNRDDWRSSLTTNDRELITEELAFYLFINDKDKIFY